MITYQKGSNQFQKKMKFSIAPDTRSSVYLLGLVLAGITILGISREHAWRNSVIAPCPDQCTFNRVYAAEVKEAGKSAQLKPLTKQEMVDQSKHPREINRIWIKETSKGANKDPQALHNLCKAQGKSNEFGYGGMAMKICFDSFEESVKVVDEWLDKRTAENLCYYNLGVKTSNCEYVR